MPPAGSAVAALEELLAQPVAAAFAARVSQLAASPPPRSCLGLNLGEGQLLSMKCYVTFHGRPDPGPIHRLLGDRRIAEEALASSRRASARQLSDYALAGSGLTVCVKVNRRREAATGFYHRLADTPFGEFHLYCQGKRQVKRYVYFERAEERAALAAAWGLPFVVRCEVIELGRGEGHGIEGRGGDEKLVLIGNFSELRPLLFTAAEERTVCAVETAYGLRAMCGGLYRNGARSAYLVAPPEPDAPFIATVQRLYGGAAGRRSRRRTSRSGNAAALHTAASPGSARGGGAARTSS